MKRKQIMAWMLAFAIIFSAIFPSTVSKATDGLNPDGNSGTDQSEWGDFGKEPEVPTDKNVPTVREYTRSVIETTYRIYNEEAGSYTYKAPTLDDYIFAGWYKNKAYENIENALKEKEELTQDRYYALFVPKAVLGVQAQVTTNLLDDDLSDDSRGAIRFATSVDSLNYQEVGFYFDIEGGATGYKGSGNSVYQKLIARNPRTGEKEGEETTYTPSNTFSPASKYFKTFTFYNISAKLYDVNITATPFWKTLDGTEVRAESIVKTVNTGRGSKTIYFSSDGDDAEGDGTKAVPYQSLNYAIEQAETGDIICVKGTVAVTENNWTAHNKDILLTGDKLDFSSLNAVNVRDGVTFTNMTVEFKDSAVIYAYGNRLRVESDTTVNGYTKVFGGGASDKTTVKSTDVTLLAGDYAAVYGGGNSGGGVSGDVHVYVAGDVNKTRDLSEKDSFIVYGGSVTGTVSGDVYVYVGGNVNSKMDVTENATERAILYGGSSRGTIEGSTYVTVEGNAQFSRIYGGGYRGTIKGDTNVTIRGNVNGSMDNWSGPTPHTWYTALFGGSYSDSEAAIVEGDSTVIIDGDAQFMYVYGGGRHAGAGENTVGNTSVTVTKNAKNARVMSIFGGSYNSTTTDFNITNKDTSVVMEAGEVQQIFGGNQQASMSGNTTVYLLGGKVTRRVYGGCYNNYDSGWVTEDCHVTGNTSIIIGSGVTIVLNASQNDRGVLAGSRYKTTYKDEVATVIFLDDAYSAKSAVLGRESSLAITLTIGDQQPYHYLVQASKGGTVSAEGNVLRITPDTKGAAVTVTGVDASYLKETEEGYLLTLPSIGKDEKKTIKVTFGK